MVPCHHTEQVSQCTSAIRRQLKSQASHPSPHSGALVKWPIPCISSTKALGLLAATCCFTPATTFTLPMQSLGYCQPWVSIRAVRQMPRMNSSCRVSMPMTPHQWPNRWCSDQAMGPATQSATCIPEAHYPTCAKGTWGSAIQASERTNSFAQLLFRLSLALSPVVKPSLEFRTSTLFFCVNAGACLQLWPDKVPSLGCRRCRVLAAISKWSPSSILCCPCPQISHPKKN